MVQQITNGIKIGVITRYEGISRNGLSTHYIFSYCINIENQSKDTVQLISRQWQISDSLKEIEIIEGEGVIGEKPIITPNNSFTYSSSCQLISSLGAMKGFFNMINLTTDKNFKVIIPSFQLSLPQILN